MQNDKFLLSADEAAVLVGLHPATLRKLASKRRIRSFKVLGALRFKREDLEGLIVERPAQQKTTSGKTSQEENNPDEENNQVK